MSVSDPGSTLAERLHRVPDLGARTRRRAAEFLDAGEPARAADLLLEEATAPTSPRRRIYAARLYLSADAPDSALDALTSDPGQYPDALRVDYWLVRARSHAGCDERTEAAESVERARRAGASAERVASIERRLEAVPSPPSAGGDTPAPRGAGDPEETTPPDLPSESDDADEEVIELDGEQLRDALLEENDEPGTTGNFRDFADPSDPAGEFYEDVDDTVIDRGSPMTREGEPDEAVAPTGEFEGESTKNWDPEQADDSTFAASNMPDTLIDHDVLQRSSGEAVDAGDAATEPPASDPSDGPTDAGSSEGAAGQASASVAAGDAPPAADEGIDDLPDHEDLPEADGDSAFHREGELDTGVYTDEDSGSVELPAEMSELPGPREDDGPASADPDVSDRDAPVGGGTAESRSSDRRPGGPSSASGSAEAASAPDTEGADRGPRGGGEPSARHAAAQPATDDSAPGEIDEAAELPTAPDPGATDARGTDERTGPGTADSGRTDDWLDRLPPTARRLVAHPRYAVASAAAILGAFLLSAYAAGAWLNRSGYRALTHRLRQAREARASDDYASHREAVSLLERALAANSPGGINHLAAWTAPIAPGPDLAAARRRVRRHLLQWSAELEYRFEEPGSRLDPQQLADLPEPGESSPLALARAYRELAEGYPGRAREAIRNAQNPPGGTTATTLARISAHLEADAPGDAAAAAEDLPSGEDRTLRITYAAGRARHRTSPGEAILTIEEVLDRNEDHLDARILRISMWLDTGSRQKALERAERALRTYGPDGADTAGSHQRARLHRLRARALLAGGREDRAEAQLGRALDATPDRAGPRAALADLALDRGALTRAADRLQSAPEQLRRSLPISLVRARLALLRSHVGRAISLLEDRRRWHARSRLLAARALSAAARDEGALELLAPLADSESPSGRAASALRARLRHRNATRGKEAAAAVDSVEQLADAAPDAPFVRLQAARTHLDAASGERGDPRERHLAAAQRHLEAIPGSTEPLLTFAWCRFHRLDGAALAADRECGRARRSEVAYLPGMLAVARYHLQAGPPSEADAVAEALMARSPGDWRAAVIRIRTLIRNAQFDRAEALLDRWAGVRSADSPVYEFLEGSVSFARGDDRRAVGYLERAHRALPERPVATTRYARCLGRLGELDGAVEALEPLLDHPTRSALAWVAFGEIRRRQGRARDALQNLRIAERRAEDGIVSDRLRARLELERALASAAVSGWQSEPVDEALGRAKELSGGGSALYDYLRGRQLLAEGGLTRARSRLERALKVRPERCKFARALWRAREASGRNPQADPIDGALRRRCGL